MVRCAVIAVLCLAVLPADSQAIAEENSGIGAVVARTIEPLMKRYGIPGIAVGIVANGQSHVYDYGVASTVTKAPVNGATLFEIGSVTKTFTATLASYAQVTGKLSLPAPASTYLPTLRGSGFDRVSLVNLGTYTAGGLPLQVPGGISDQRQLMTYLRRWKALYAAGTQRTYSNVSIGLLGTIVAKSEGVPFGHAMQRTLLAPLRMDHTYLDVPSVEEGNYAQGYTSAGKPIRMAPGVLGPETFGIRTTAADLLRFVEANMLMLHIDPLLQRAITQTHTGYYRAGAMTQDLIWEQYRYPVDLERLLEGNSIRMLYESNPVVALHPPLAPRDDVWLNKTGSTNGFASYVAFVPGRHVGIVLLANKSYPIAARVKAAYDLLRQI
jgi:beta-lactamase class C